MTMGTHSEELYSKEQCKELSAVDLSERPVTDNQLKRKRLQGFAQDEPSESQSFQIHS